MAITYSGIVTVLIKEQSGYIAIPIVLRNGKYEILQFQQVEDAVKYWKSLYEKEISVPSESRQIADTLAFHTMAPHVISLPVNSSGKLHQDLSSSIYERGEGGKVMTRRITIHNGECMDLIFALVKDDVLSFIVKPINYND